MQTVFQLELAGMIKVFYTLADIKASVQGMKLSGYVKSGDKAIITQGVEYPRKGLIFEGAKKHLIIS